MFIQPLNNASSHLASHDALAACATLLIIGCLIYAFGHTKPSTQRVLLRLMFQPLLATTLLFTLWLMGLLFCLFLVFTR